MESTFLLDRLQTLSFLLTIYHDNILFCFQNYDESTQICILVAPKANLI
jgi:hypothetical protein